MVIGGRGLVVVALGVVVLALGGCVSGGGGERYSDEEAARRTAILTARPALEEMAARGDAMAEEIRTAISMAVPVGPWYPNRQPSDPGNCDGFSYTWGQSRAGGTWLIDGGIPEELWPGALAAARSVTDRYGYGAPSVAVDRPRHHALRIYGPDDAYVWFGASENAVLDVITGCYLPEERWPRPDPEKAPK